MTIDVIGVDAGAGDTEASALRAICDDCGVAAFVDSKPGRANWTSAELAAIWSVLSAQGWEDRDGKLLCECCAHEAALDRHMRECEAGQ